MDVHEKLEMKIRAKELYIREQDGDSPSKARQESLLANMKRTALELEEDLYGALVGTSTPGEAGTSTPGGALNFDED